MVTSATSRTGPAGDHHPLAAPSSPTVHPQQASSPHRFPAACAGRQEGKVTVTAGSARCDERRRSRRIPVTAARLPGLRPVRMWRTQTGQSAPVPAGWNRPSRTRLNHWPDTEREPANLRALARPVVTVAMPPVSDRRERLRGRTDALMCAVARPDAGAACRPAAHRPADWRVVSLLIL